MSVKEETVETLALEMGWDGSESGSEAFLFKLSNAVFRVECQIARSHEEGLCYDAIRALAGELNSD